MLVWEFQNGAISCKSKMPVDQKIRVQVPVLELILVFPNVSVVSTYISYYALSESPVVSLEENLQCAAVQEIWNSRYNMSELVLLVALIGDSLLVFPQETSSKILQPCSLQI